ncbi:MAG: transposase [Wendovervirus sonii]|uniref:Transposase n=1 Tax=phage Lak_Megaphage_Sonny TaxID=3109229 RepID=A0ABZ0Z6M8_9CAUD|nr:MAG: transposase [phage Lak_Megaphage_Sonny]
MKLVDRHIVKKSNKHYEDLLELLHKSKNLYNAACYMVRQHYFRMTEQQYTEDLINEDKKYANYQLINKYMKELKNPDYNALPINTSQEVLKQVDKAYISFFKLLKLKQQGLYEEDIDIPGYKNKNGYNLLVFNRMFISDVYLKKGLLKIPKTDIVLKINKLKTEFNQLRILLQGKDIVLEFIYDKDVEIVKGLDPNKFYSIDLGLNNLATVASNCSQSFIISGKHVKQINQRYNKEKAHLQTKLNIKEQIYNLEGLDKSVELPDEEYKKLQKKHSKDVKYTSKQIKDIGTKRKYKIEDYFHKSTRYIVNQAVENHIGTIIIGQNKGWKQDINIGKKNDQNFVDVPFCKFISMLTYKAELKGIKVVLTEESYTSKASFIDNDFIPVYDEENHVEYEFSGKRIKRGLYKSKEGILMNADLNGAFNIMRKIIPNVTVEGLDLADKGFLFNPQRIDLSKQNH